MWLWLESKLTFENTRMPTGNIWSHGDPNTADDGDMCESITIQNICADGTSTCSTGSECTGCNADGSMVLFTLADPDTTADYLEIENFDAWLQEAVCRITFLLLLVGLAV